MEIKKGKLALASAATFGTAYLVCAAVVLVAPDFALKLFGWLFHLVNLEQFTGGVEVTIGSLIGGLVEVVVYAYLVAWLFAWFYNRFLTK